ncbi:MAG: hypothetical protein LBD22_02885 [Spirochaetaceae bacterium]|jgi:ribosomal protein S18 acetylase RimI-like enzyme|nr:hypothetical protein [Spirochaetaceae bacterium]
MVIKNAAEFDDTIREKLSKLFVENFEKELSFISKNKKTLIQALAHIFVLDTIYVVIIDNEPAGIIGSIDKERRSVKFKINKLIKHLGMIKAFLVMIVLKQHINMFPQYSVEKYTKTASIAFVAVDRKYMKMGVLLEMLKRFLSYINITYIIEVEETKREAMWFYQQLGFKEVYRENYLFPKSLVKNNVVYMLYNGVVC